MQLACIKVLSTFFGLWKAFSVFGGSGIGISRRGMTQDLYISLGIHQFKMEWRPTYKTGIFQVLLENIGGCCRTRSWVWNFWVRSSRLRKQKQKDELNSLNWEASVKHRNNRQHKRNGCLLVEVYVRRVAIDKLLWYVSLGGHMKSYQKLQQLVWIAHTDWTAQLMDVSDMCMTLFCV